MAESKHHSRPEAGSRERSKSVKLLVTLDPDALMPTRAHDTDAGLDLYAREDAVIPPGGFYRFNTGVHMAIPEGYAGFVKSKSGLMCKHGLVCDGVVDAGYTGAIHVALFNHGAETVEIQRRQKIAQLVVLPVALCKLKLVTELLETERSDGGFGSTGAF